MKKSTKKITIKIPGDIASKLRAKRVHFVLFAENSPFKPKRVESKKKYKRNSSRHDGDE